MPRATRNSLAAASDAFALAGATNAGLDSSASVWSPTSRRRLPSTSTSAAAAAATRRRNRPSAASSIATTSTTSASLTSPVANSSSLSEAESYATRHVDGLVEQQLPSVPRAQPERRTTRTIIESEDEEDDDRQRQRLIDRYYHPRAGEIQDAYAASFRQQHADNPDMLELELEQSRGSPTTSNNNGDNEYMAARVHSELVDDDEDNDETATTSDIDSLADAEDSEVERRVLENLGWETIGKDRELEPVDVQRWKTISELHITEGTDEYETVKAIQADLLKLVQDLDATDWQFPEPSAFRGASLLPSSSGSGSRRLGNELPFHNEADPSSNWADTAFNLFRTTAAAASMRTGSASVERHGRDSLEERLRFVMQQAAGGQGRTQQVDLEAIQAQAREALQRHSGGGSGGGDGPRRSSASAGGASAALGSMGREGAAAVGREQIGTSLERGVGLVTL